VATSARRKRQPLANRLLVWLLGSPVSGVLDGSLLRLTVRGRHSGRAITFPVQYAAGDDAIWVCPGRPSTKTWWRNLMTASPVELRLRARPRVRTHHRHEGAGVFPGSGLLRGPLPQNRTLPQGGGRQRLGGRSSPDTGRRAGAGADGDEPVGQRPAQDHSPASSWCVVLLAFGFSWSYWIPVALSGGHWSHFPGLAGPMLSAIVITAITKGGSGLRDLLARLVRWRVPLRWYAASAMPAGVAAVAIAAQAAVGVDLPRCTGSAPCRGCPASAGSVCSPSPC
jgi:hypothetical protein